MHFPRNWSICASPPARSAAVAAAMVALLALIGVFPTPRAHATWIPDGLGVVVDPATQQRTATIAGGQVLLLHVVAETDPEAGGPSVVAARAYQFGLEIDPRLVVTGVDFPPQVVFPNIPAPLDYILGLGDCIELGGGPVVLLTVHVLLPLAQAGATDLRVDVRPLADGREMLFNTCYDEGDLRRFEPAGGVVLNPSAPSIVRFVGSPSVVVEGRDAVLAWETFGASSVALNGAPVAAAQSLTLQPTADTSWTLTASASNLTVQATHDVQVVRRPRVDLFTAEPFVLGEETMVRLAWDVRGADVVWLDGDQPAQPLSGALVPLRSPAVWTLLATNEWGSTGATAGFDLGELPPVIVGFSASPNPFSPGQAVTLTWTAIGAQSASIEPGVGSVDPMLGSIEVQPTASTTYTLVMTNANGTSTASVLAQMLAPGIQAFTAIPNQIYPGESTTLSWSVEAFETLRIDPQVGPLSEASGSVQVTPQQANTVYVLTVENSEGTVTAQALVQWKLPGASLSASQTAPFATDPVTLTAAIEGADTATLLPQVGAIPPAGGQFEVLVHQPTTFVLTAMNAAGITTRQVTITPKIPAVTLSASTRTPFPDQPVTFTVDIQGAEAATFEPGFGAIAATGGEFTTNVATTTEFVVTATNAAGTRTQQVTVTPQPPAIVRFVANPAELVVGQTSVLEWDVAHADAIAIEPGGITGLPATGTLPIDPPANITYTLTASNSAGVSTATASITRTTFSIMSFTATPSHLLPGQTTTLAWEVIGQALVSIDGFGPQPMQGSMVLQPDVTTNYILRAQNGDVMATRSALVLVGSGTGNAMVLSWSSTEYPGQTPLIGPFTPFDFWVLALDPPGGIEAFECSVHLPAGMIVAGGRTLMPGSTDFGVGDDNWIVGTGGVCLSGAVVPLVRYSYCLFLGPVPEGAVLSLAGATPSSFPNGNPGYLRCNSPGDLNALEPGPPLPLGDSGDPTPALVLELQARPTDGGVRVEWKLPGGRVADAVEVLRRADGGAARVVQRLEDSAAAAGWWVDGSAEPGAAYLYSAVADVAGGRVASSEVAVATGRSAVAARPARLLANVPNPFNPRTELRFELSAPADVRLTIVDAAGRRVRQIDLPAVSTGVHAFVWQGDDDAGRPVGSGVYRVQLSAGSERDVRSVTLVR